MKLFVVLALLGVCAGNICTETESTIARSLRETFVDPRIASIFGHCPGVLEAFQRSTGKQKDIGCPSLFNEGYCFATNLMNEYGSDEVDVNGCPDNTELTYTDLADIAETEVKQMGNAVCKHGFKCVERIINKIDHCSKNDESFYETAWNKTKEVFKELVSEEEYTEYWKDAEEMLKCAGFTETDYVMCMFNEAKKKFDTQANLLKFLDGDVKAFLEEIRSTKGANVLLEDIIAGYNTFKTQGKDFCSSKCVCKSAQFFSDMFNAMHNDGAEVETYCAKVETYCGGCETNANAFIASFGEQPGIPCCTKAAIKNLMEAYDSLEINHGDFITSIKDQLMEKMKTAVTCNSQNAYNIYKNQIDVEGACLDGTADMIKAMTCSNADCTLTTAK